VFHPVKPALLADPSSATATFRRTDELLRLRMFEDAAAEARSLPLSRGRDVRLAEAEFSLGHFPAAAEAARRAFPDLGTPSAAGGGVFEDPARSVRGQDPVRARGL